MWRKRPPGAPEASGVHPQRPFAVESGRRSDEESSMAVMSPDARRSGRGNRRSGPVRRVGPFVAALAALVGAQAHARPGAVPDELSSEAARRGPVRVIAELAVAFTPEGELPRPAGVAEQRAAIA